ncbi:MAG: SDR family oxidoreductase [Deltaproteobacteria bacterium]|nr:SDR family oxidoreductase [Deltaproteobacteria bacterium]
MEFSYKSLVVVFGGGGYVGYWVTEKLLASGYRVRVFDKFLFGREGIDTLKHPDLEIVYGDMCDVNAVYQAVGGADCVILLAALVGKRFVDLASVPYREVNFIASSVVLDSAVEHGVERFIFTSTDSVYGELNGLVYETAVPEPMTLYARLKLRFEERLLKAKKRTFHPTVLRLGTCYGFSRRMRFDLIPNTFIRDAVYKNQVVVQAPDSIRSFIHVCDAARAIVACVNTHVNLISGEIFNLAAADQAMSFKDVTSVVKQIWPSVEVELMDGEADLMDYKLSSKKLEKLLDFNFEYSLRQGLEDLRDILLEGKCGDPYSIKHVNG